MFLKIKQTVIYSRLDMYGKAYYTNDNQHPTPTDSGRQTKQHHRTRVGLISLWLFLLAFVLDDQ
jgi:hypothetical protein